jgi:GNAT superfamily N-acetyltransferase
MACVRPDGETADLDALFVDPPAIGSGAGRTLFAASVALARRWGARRLTILADPHAALFYERLGASFLRNAPSDAISGRVLPLYEYDLTSRTV